MRLGIPDLFAHGYLAVDFFFVLSGFVIAKTQTPLVAQGDALVHLAVPGAEGRDEPAERRRRR